MLSVPVGFFGLNRKNAPKMVVSQFSPSVRKKQTISRLSGHVVVLYVIFFSFQKSLFPSIFRKSEKTQRGDPITTDFPLNHLTEISQPRARIFAGSSWPKWKGKYCSYEYLFCPFQDRGKNWKLGMKIRTY